MEITILNLKRLKRDLYRLYSNRTKWGINATICHYPIPIPYNLNSCLKSPQGIQNPVLGADPITRAQLRAQTSNICDGDLAISGLGKIGIFWDFDGFWQRTFHNLKKTHSVFTKAFAMTSSTISPQPLHPPFQGHARAPRVMFVALQSP